MVSPFSDPHIRRESGYVWRTHTCESASVSRALAPPPRTHAREERESSRARARVSRLLFHTTYLRAAPTGRRAILRWRRTCRHGDKRQIPTAGDELPKRRGGAVKRGATRDATRVEPPGYLRGGERKRVVPRRSPSSCKSVGIPAFRLRLHGFA